ncbi:MAG: DUF488 domain-containing protein [Cyanobacteriota bacterium]
MIYTIGHSNRSINEFVELLIAFNITLLIDVRSIPGSKKFPQFNENNIKKSLEEDNIGYLHLSSFGGFRKKTIKHSPNTGIENKGFQAYADYMLTEDFENSINKLIELSKNNILCLMCAESLPENCHRNFISDFLTIKNIDVTHVIDKYINIPHSLNSLAIFTHNRLIYPTNGTEQLRLF